MAAAPMAYPSRPNARALASDQVADLATDQDERGRYQRLKCDRALYAAHCRVEISNHCRDGHIHNRRVDDEYEHRHGEQDGERPSWPTRPSRCDAPARPSESHIQSSRSEPLLAHTGEFIVVERTAQKIHPQRVISACLALRSVFGTRNPPARESI
jgi:hypothetical protein